MRLVRDSDVDVDAAHGIDVAAMLDFVLGLLSFFNIVALFTKNPGVQFILPAAKINQTCDTGKSLIGIHPDGDVWLDRKPVTLPKVHAVFERMHLERPDDAVVIAADKDPETAGLTKVTDPMKAKRVLAVSMASRGADGG